MIFPSSAELISPELVSKICRTKTLLSASLGKYHSDLQVKLRLSTCWRSPASHHGSWGVAGAALNSWNADCTHNMASSFPAPWALSEMSITPFYSSPTKHLIFLPPGSLSFVGQISPLKVRQAAEYTALLHWSLLLCPLHCAMAIAHHRDTERSLGTIPMDY